MMKDNAEQRAFTSWKLDMLDAMSVDPEVTDADFRVAFRMMQHVNSVSRIAWPSVDRLAVQLARSRDSIMASTKRLCAALTKDGRPRLPWMRKSRPHKRAANQYGFMGDRANMVLDAMHQRMEDFENDKFEVANLQPQNPFEVANHPGFEVANPPYVEVANLQHKHLNGTTLEEHLHSKGSEDCEASAYARAKRRTA
ncbi:hypothetical protein EN962_13965 [Mesorhizobium sp. M7A.F.Ca.CA.001.09.2.1]|uniref:Helix-turn-helix domain-containing protein n=1 Tax=Mesorhizobium ciceri TaxID=39645 RepID=A0AB38T4L2_9HYPH|nr:MULTISPECIES: hypothetical protein [Mesorhizobium]RUY55478.1 hypothetical protein EN981_06720 [Mesorhizobium sp. M7A.F.Ca.CA.001.13.2.1]MDF3216276.1 hypothetical protein [Mesorhizobium ciceri]RUY62995.1 hypothetical protein EN965_23975 [Mesorhizobium sp. M7A.F.Ca.CA.001.05.1.1]RUY65226.1 hypothetical protein EN980_23300 [Mesorhizobium sp. M7A.F.Ca.CA.001.13.1.1]RUY78065.1 hypothetical protein EN962_13965 [Mesorhizobium sp. M7A.F.Ca.CA.001.09.2.1]